MVKMWNGTDWVDQSMGPSKGKYSGGDYVEAGAEVIAINGKIITASFGDESAGCAQDFSNLRKDRETGTICDTMTVDLSAARLRFTPAYYNPHPSDDRLAGYKVFVWGQDESKIEKGDWIGILGPPETFESKSGPVIIVTITQ